MNINNLPLNPWELEYIWSEDKIAFVLKVGHKDLQDFIKDDTSEFYINITEDDYLQFRIKFLNVKRGTIITTDIQPSYRNDEEVVGNLRKLLKQNNIDFFMSDGITTYRKVLKVFDNDKPYIEKWLGDDVIINKPSLEDEFKNVPTDYMIPQKIDTAFWFLCKVNNNIFDTIKKSKDKIKFGAEIFHGNLVLCLYIENPFVTLYLSNDENSGLVLINNQVREDFKVFSKFNVITFLINNDECKEENIIDVTLNIDEKFKALIKSYMNI